MKVRLTTCIYIQGEAIYEPGEQIEVSDAEAADLIVKGSAESIDMNPAE